MSATTSTGPATPAAATVLEQVGRWQLVERLATGTWSEVFAARPDGARDDGPAAYALKRLQPHCEREPRATAMLAREAIVAAEVTHPHLISVLVAHVERAPFYVVMPRLAGQSLDQRLSSGDRPSLAETLWIGRQVSEALAALEQAGWLHGDVKPQNIFVGPAGHATLLDLGFARRRDEAIDYDAGHLLGTPHYLAPELISSVLQADIRSDIYALGATLYEMLAGRVPFEGDLPTVATKQRQETPPRLRTLASQVPEPVAELIHNMLAKEPLRRPQTAGKLCERLVDLEIRYLAAR